MAAEWRDLPVRDDGRGTHHLCACIAGAEVIARRGMVALGLVRLLLTQTGGSSECPKRLRVWTGNSAHQFSPRSAARMLWHWRRCPHCLGLRNEGSRLGRGRTAAPFREVAQASYSDEPDARVTNT